MESCQPPVPIDPNGRSPFVAGTVETHPAVGANVFDRVNQVDDIMPPDSTENLQLRLSLRTSLGCSHNLPSLKSLAQVFTFGVQIRQILPLLPSLPIIVGIAAATVSPACSDRLTSS